MEIVQQLVSDQALNLLLSAGIGAFLGLRRELEQQTKHFREFMGIRTMMVLTVLGTVSTMFPSLPNLPIILFFTFFILVALAYARQLFLTNHVGMTTELIAMFTFWLGVLVGIGNPIIAILLTIFLAMTNEFREDIHKFVRTLKPAELRGSLQLLIISGAVLPFLPRYPIDPWGVFVPFNFWLLVILISGIGFLGYFLTKYFSEKKGTLLSGFLGSLVSSTAVSASLARQSKRYKKVNIFAAGIMIALGTMQIRVFLEIFLIGDLENQFSLLMIPVVMAIASGLSAWWILTHNGNEKVEASSDFKLKSPFEIIPALKFGLVFIVILFAINFGKIFFGDKGVYLVSFLSGLVDVDAIVLSSLESEKLGEMSGKIASISIVISLIVNTVVKIIYASILGSKELVKKISVFTCLTAFIGIVFSVLVL